MWSTLVLNTMVEKLHGFDPIMYAFFFDLPPPLLLCIVVHVII